MTLTPPCIATMIMIKYQTNSYGWMIFATFYPIILGLIVSSLVFTIGRHLNVDGLDAMRWFYGIVFVITVILGFIQNKPILIKENK